MLQSPDVQFVQIRVVLGFFWLLTVNTTFALQNLLILDYQSVTLELNNNFQINVMHFSLSCRYTSFSEKLKLPTTPSKV